MDKPRSSKRIVLIILAALLVILAALPPVMIRLIIQSNIDSRPFIFGMYVMEAALLLLIGGALALTHRWHKQSTRRFEAIITLLTADDAKVKVTDVSTEQHNRTFILIKDPTQSIGVVHDLRSSYVRMSAQGTEATLLMQQIWTATNPKHTPVAA